MSDRPERLYETAWTQALKSLNPDVFYIALSGPGPSQLTYDFMVERGIRQPRQTREVGDGLADLVLRTKTPLLVGGVEQEQGPYPFSWIGAPLLVEDRVLGLVSAQTSRSGAFERRDLLLVAVLANWIASELESARQYRQLQRESESSATVLLFAKTLAERAGATDVFKTVAEVIPAVIEDVRCTVWSRADLTGEFVPVWRSNGAGTAEKCDLLPAYLRGIPGVAQMITARDVVVVQGLDRARPEASAEKARVLDGRVVALVPFVTTEDEVVGLAVASRSSDGLDLTPWDVRLLRGVADVASIALERQPRRGGKVMAPVENSEFKTRMLSTLSHEVRTPLSLISTGAELIMDKLAEPEKLRQVAELVNEGATRLATVVGEVIEYAELQTQPVVPCLEVREVVKVVQDAIDDAVGQAGHKVVLSAEPLPSIMVDAEKLRSVITKLVKNAVNYSSDAAKVQVGVSVEANTLTVKVSDEGVGIPQEEMDCVFKPFFRGEASQTRGLSGTGLGLPIARQLVEAMGGDIRLQSQANNGTTVTVSIPVVEVAPSSS